MLPTHTTFGVTILFAIASNDFMEDSHLKDLTFFAGENLPPK
jgi:hypothetical protein